VSSPTSWSPALNAAYQHNLEESFLAVQAALATVAIPSPPNSPDFNLFPTVLSPPIRHPFETLLDAAALAAEYDEFIEDQLHRLATDPERQSAFLAAAPDSPQLQYPADQDVAALSPVRYNWSPLEDIPVEDLPPPVLFAPVATVTLPRPESPIDYGTSLPRPVTPIKEEPISPTLAATAVQPTPAADFLQVDFQLLPHLFVEPPCVVENQTRHPHQYTVVYENDRQVWCPQAEYLNPDCIRDIPRVADLDDLFPHFLTTFRSLVYHSIKLKPVGANPAPTICAKVGRHPSSLHFPFGYLESSFVDSLKFLFGQLPFNLLVYFEGTLVPLVAYDFLDGRTITICGHIHFEDRDIFVINRSTRFEDVLRTHPGLFPFVATPRLPVNPTLYISPPALESPL
jgi:hypothetical protein